MDPDVHRLSTRCLRARRQGCNLEGWNPLHVVIATNTNCSVNPHCTEKEVDRVQHDYQVHSIAYHLYL